MDLLNNRKVAAIKTSETVYPEPPYHPSVRYPEFKHTPISSRSNSVYDAIRQSLYALGLDAVNYNSPDWNPLGEMIQPGQTVIVKPNLVSHFNWGYKSGLTDTESLVTHGSVIRCVIDFVALALNNNGKIIVGDSPVQLTDWQQLLDLIHFTEIAEHVQANFSGIELTSCDYRLETGSRGVFGTINQAAGHLNAQDFLEIDLRNKSLLVDLKNAVENLKFGVTDYPSWRMSSAHDSVHNKYLFPRQILEADTLINLPKLKTHSKAGFTCALKNLVGINGLKDYLPHFCYGSPNQGGDEYPDSGILFDLINLFSHKTWDSTRRLQKNAYALATKMLKGAFVFLQGNDRSFFNIMGGGWYGNDTLWRTILDVNRAFFYADHAGNLAEQYLGKKKYFVIVDGIIGGEKYSPLLPTPRKGGFILAGVNPVAVDVIATTLMGFDYHKLKQLSNALDIDDYPLIAFAPEKIELKSNFNCRSVNDIISSRSFVPFEPSIGYHGYIELSEI